MKFSVFLFMLICSCWVFTAEACAPGNWKGGAAEPIKNNPKTSNKNKNNYHAHNQNQSHSKEGGNFSNAIFSTSLYEAVKESEPQNFVLSPLSVRNALAMVSLGAVGETAKEIRESLQFPITTNILVDEQSQLIKSLKEISLGNPGVEFVTADKMYATLGLRVKTQYKKDVTGLGGQIETLDFGNSGEAAGKINSWVHSTTAGKIQKIFEASALNSDISLLVLNTIYFKGLWKNQFSPSDTEKRPFFIDGTKNVSVEMMTQENEFHYAFLQEANAKVIILPYKGGRLSMMIFLPQGNGQNPLDTLENWLKNKSSFEIQNQHLTRTRTVSVFLPKFKIRSSLQLNEPLKSLGLGKMFDPVAANFSGIFNGPQNFFVSKVSQETFIEVNEEGTEAAAATGFEVSATSFGSQFKADRPFLFQILDSTTKTVLFTGRVKNPLDPVDSDSETNMDQIEQPLPTPSQEKQSTEKMPTEFPTLTQNGNGTQENEAEINIKEQSQVHATKTTATEEQQYHISPFASVSASGVYSNGTSKNWVYNSTLLGPCWNFNGDVESVNPSSNFCVVLHENPGCSGKNIPINAVDWRVYWDWQNPFGPKQSPKSIGIC